MIDITVPNGVRITAIDVSIKYSARNPHSFSHSEDVADAHCFWYNEDADLWSNEGCTSTRDVMTGDVLCSCSHLTTFATIHNLHRECNEYVDEWRSSSLWDYFNLMIGSVFLFIFVYSFYEIYPFWKIRHNLKWKKHRAMFAIFMIGVTAFLSNLYQVSILLRNPLFVNGIPGFGCQMLRDVLKLSDELDDHTAAGCWTSPLAFGWEWLEN